MNLTQTDRSVEMEVPSEYRICTRCIMDTSDPEITFDTNGRCHHCQSMEPPSSRDNHFLKQSEKQWLEIAQTIRASSKHLEHDCLIGVSGGVDSSYLVYRAVQDGLRPIVLHVDAGWNSELAVKNIENMVKKLHLELLTYVVDWEEMRKLQVAFLRSGIANQDVPQDHAFAAAVFQTAAKHKVKYILHGANPSTESILPAAWGYNSRDLVHLESIYERFGGEPLRNFPKLSFFKYQIYYPYLLRMKVVCPLMYLPFTKQEVVELLKRELGWRDYGGKHHESRFTKFFQSYFLPVRFGYDKRRAHLSSLIISNQITRDQALEEMKRPPYIESDMQEDKEFVRKKLGLTRAEFEEILRLPKTTYRDFSWNHLFFLREYAVQIWRTIRPRS